MMNTNENADQINLSGRRIIGYGMIKGLPQSCISSGETPVPDQRGRSEKPIKNSSTARAA